jgi:hypothetical protein
MRHEREEKQTKETDRVRGKGNKEGAKTLYLNLTLTLT